MKCLPCLSCLLLNRIALKFLCFVAFDNILTVCFCVGDKGDSGDTARMLMSTGSRVTLNMKPSATIMKARRQESAALLLPMPLTVRL